MNQVAAGWTPLRWVLCGALASPLLGQSPSDKAVRVSAQVQADPPGITLTWPADSRSVIYFIQRKLRDASTWSDYVELGTGVTSYTDTDVLVGGAYEYWITKWTEDTFVLAGEGYIYAGIEVPLVESRGKVVLAVDRTHSADLATELVRLQQDLVGDGWTVLRRDTARTAVEPASSSAGVGAARSNEIAGLKALVTAEYSADPERAKTVFLFGHVPVPYSGDLFPDAHPEHQGAWPADGYYGEMDGTWTDVTINRMSASDPRNRNVPADGKFDQTLWPVSEHGRRGLELEVGRVDLADLPAFRETERELLRQYLSKNHGFRHKKTGADRRGLIDDNLGWFLMEAPAVNGWRDFAAFFGASNTIAGDWLNVPSSQSYLWGFGCGGGNYTSCSGVASTADLANNDPGIIFTMLFGSYFGDWDSENNLLRASIATRHYTLTSAWVTRPSWHFHHMGLGETIGFSTRVTQNNDGIRYSANTFQNSVHIALMGDPTLRMHVVAPPSGLVLKSNPRGGTDLHWRPSPDDVLGYAIYWAPTADGPFARLNPELVTGTNYTDSVDSTNVYMVRAVKLEVSASGTYYNASQGIFKDRAGTFDLPPLQIAQGQNSVVLSWPATVTSLESRLEATDSLGWFNWSSVTNPVQITDGLNSVTVGLGGAGRFFRLIAP